MHNIQITYLTYHLNLFMFHAHFFYAEYLFNMQNAANALVTEHITIYLRVI